MDLRNETMLVLGDLIGFPTVTSESNLDLIGYVDDRLSGLGARIDVTKDEAGTKANLLATIGPPVDGGVLLTGHTDVVPADEQEWTGQPFVAMRRHQRVYGRGAVDMKGFLACLLTMAPAFADAPLTRPVHLGFTFDEEEGCRGMPLLLERLAETGPMPAAAIVGEPTSLRIIEAHKGCYEYTTTFRGLEGHGSVPARSVNAVEYAARFVNSLLEFGRELARSGAAVDRYDPPQTTISVGRIDGGTARNVVAGECRVEWEMRPVTRADAMHVERLVESERAALEAAMRELHPAAEIVTETIGAVGGLEVVEESPARDLAMRLTEGSDVDVVSFGTEAGLLQAAGIPAVVCGPGSIDQAHRVDEFIAIEELERCLAMLDRLIPRLVDGGIP